MSPAQAIHRATAAVALACALACLAHPAAAEAPEAQPKRARELAAQATQAFNAGDFSRAVALVRQAYALDPEPVLLYNLARALEASGDDAGARDAYQRYLEVLPDAPDRGAVQGRIEILDKRLLERTKLEQKQRSERSPTPSKPVTETQGSAATTPPRPAPSILPWIVVGVGVASLGTGAALGLAAQSEREDGAAASTTGREARDAEERAQSLARWSNVTLAAGAALSIAGVTWLLIDTSSKRGQATRRSLSAHVGWFCFGVSGQL